jgi:hypothetical protein
MGLTTGKILDYATRVKTCPFCDYTKIQPQVERIYDCRIPQKQWIQLLHAVDMLNNVPKQNIKYSVYTEDDDSTTEAHIHKKLGYKVDKLSNMHMKTEKIINPMTI